MFTNSLGSPAPLPRLTYAIVPPNQTTPLARRQILAAEQSARIASLPIDALLVYDVQDEAARNGTRRPFCFVPKVDPLSYAYDALKLGSLPRIVYRAVAQQNSASLRSWVEALRGRGGRAVLVGAPSGAATSSLALSEAFTLCRDHAPELPFGGVLIPERHRNNAGEDARAWRKMQLGCQFFVSQTVWCVETSKRLLRDLCIRAEREHAAPPPISFTFSPCGSAQTLDFLEWLGVAVPSRVKKELLTANDMLSRSIDLAADAFAEIRGFAHERGLTVGCNVESVTARAVEVQASLELLQRIDQLAPRALTRSSAHSPSRVEAPRAVAVQPGEHSLDPAAHPRRSVA